MVQKRFKKLVEDKFNTYNNLFLNLPFHQVGNIGALIPILQESCREGLSKGHSPHLIFDTFYKQHLQSGHLRQEGERQEVERQEGDDEKEKIDFIFRLIQYIERQIVLFDSVEDAAFPDLKPLTANTTLKDYLHMKEGGDAGEELYKTLAHKISTFSARIVLTSHPTQFYSPAVLDIIANLRTLIKKNDIEAIEVALQQLGMTSLVNTSKPTPLDEAKNVIHLLRSVYYGALGELYHKIVKDLEDESFDNTAIVQLGFWPGGDRDGNPHVRAATTMAVADELRSSLFKCYYHDIKELSRKLTFSGIKDDLLELKGLLYQNMFINTCPPLENENPEQTNDSRRGLCYDDIINPLLKIRQRLITSYNSLYLQELDSLIEKVKIFQTHFATLDIRQNHLTHQQTVTFILKKQNLIQESLDELPRSALIEILTTRDIAIDPAWLKEAAPLDEGIRDTIENMMQLREIQDKNGERGCNRYIISNSEEIFSVLYVFALLRWCAFGRDEISFDIIPLFESMAAVENCQEIMRRLFEIAPYRSHIAQRQNRHTIMLGFSDGTKDGGYLKANWSIFTAKERLSEVCRHYGVKAIFFDGRGGPPARGGGKTHRFYAAQTSRISSEAIELTIQGQTITSKYGTREHFMHNCEQLLTAALSHAVNQKRNAISQENRRLIERLAEISFAKYRELKNHPLFLPYLEEKSVLKYYGQTKIASRPSKRGDAKKLSLSDLRAIPFVGSWSQLKQNVPGYFGIGSAIQSLAAEGELEKLKRCYREVPLFQALISNSMMSLYKCNFSLTAHLAADQKYGEFWRLLHEEYKLSKEMVLLISEQQGLMDEEEASGKSIEIRERTILPLLVIQQYALQKIEAGFDGSEGGEDLAEELAYKKIVKRSLYGSINASRNSA